MNKLDTSNPYKYKYETKSLEICVLDGTKTNKLESLRVTLSMQKIRAHNILGQSIDLYNNSLVEKQERKCTEHLEVGTSVVRSALQELTKELENHRFLLIWNEEQEHKPYIMQLSAREDKDVTADMVIFHEIYAYMSQRF